MNIETFISSIIMKQGILAALLLILIVLFRRFIIELFKIVLNNTEAMTKNAEALREVKAAIEKCNR